MEMTEEAIPSKTMLRSSSTSALLDLVVDQNYTGPAWDELIRRLVSYAHQDLSAAIRNGRIITRCRKAGYGLKRNFALQHDPYPEEIAAEAVEACLRRLKEKILLPGAWDPTVGVSLEVFFTECCLPDVANAYRRPLRRMSHGEMSLDSLLDEYSPRFSLVVADATVDPEEIVTARDLIVQTLKPLGLDDRRALVLEGYGWSRADIAILLDILPNTPDARLSRARRRLLENRRRSQ